MPATTVSEPSRQLPVIASYDVVVCGGGPAGVAAALAAARSGARTCLVELHGALGGIWTTGVLSYILDADNKDGIMAELIRRFEAAGARNFEPDGSPTPGYDPERVKLELDRICLEAGIEIRLLTRVVAALRDDAGGLSHVVTESKSGREAIAGKVFIDCTGDGDLGALAGCGFDLGHPETGAMQPMSMLMLVSGVSAEAIRPFWRLRSEPWAPAKDRLREEMERGGHSPSYAKPSIFPIRDDLLLIMANHEYGFNGTRAEDLTQATLRSRQECNDLIDGLRSLGGVWANARIVATSAQIGVREGRRVHGLYTMTAEDLRDGARFPDAVCHVTFGIDVHSTTAKAGKGIEAHPFKSQPYDIPLRALVARDVDGLMMAGRCISGDFIAHSSYRVTGNAVALGEAAGKAAAEAARTGKTPREIALARLA